MRLNSSQCHFILPAFPHLPQHKPTSEVIEMEMKREKNPMEKYFYPPHPMSTWMAMFSIHYVSPWRRHATATVLCLKKLKEQRKEKLMCFHLFCLFDESEAGPIIQYIIKCGDYIFFLCFLQNVNTVHICGTRVLCVVDTKDVDAQNIKKGQLHMNSSWHSKVSMIMLMKIVFGQAKIRELETVFNPTQPQPSPSPATAGY